MANVKKNEKVTAVLNVAIEGNDVLCGKCGDVIGKVVKGETEAVESNGGVLAVPMTEAMVEQLRGISPVFTPGIPAGNAKPSKGVQSALAAIERFKKRGMDTAGMMPAEDADGNAHVWTIKDGKMVDIIMSAMQSISESGIVHDPRIFGRFIVSEMFDALEYVKKTWNSKAHKYDKEFLGYQGWLNRFARWSMYSDLLRTVNKMNQVSKKDPEVYAIMSTIYQKRVFIDVMEYYLEQLIKQCKAAKQHTCNKYVRGQKYIHIYGIAGGDGKGNVFVENLEHDIYAPVRKLIKRMHSAKNMQQIRDCYSDFMRGMIPTTVEAAPKSWQNAFKAWGAFFTMQNLILFHGSRVHVHATKYPYNTTKVMTEAESIDFLCRYTKDVCLKGDGYKVLGMLKHMIEDNGIDFAAKRKQWRDEYEAKRRG